MVYFIGGALFGALFCLAVMAITTLLLGRPKLIPNEKGPALEEQDVDRKYAMSIATQWQNMATYDGTDNGQKDIER